MKKLIKKMHFLGNVILLNILYILGIGLVAIAAKLTGKRFLMQSRFGKRTSWNKSAKRIDLDKMY